MYVLSQLIIQVVPETAFVEFNISYITVHRIFALNYTIYNNKIIAI